jgi:hypothetical protein
MSKRGRFFSIVIIIIYFLPAVRFAGFLF